MPTGLGGMLLERTQNQCGRPSPAASVGHAIVICCTEWKMIQAFFFSSGTVVRVHHGTCCIQGLTELAFRFGEQHAVLHSDVSSETDACE